MPVIRTESLSKNYGKFTVVDNVSIEANEGEVYGFLGLNGAGKTTTIRMLLGMIKPSKGSVSLFGKRIESGNDLWNTVGYLVESPHAYGDLTVQENLSIYFYYRKLKDKRQIDSIVNDLSLDKYRDVKAKYLSLGNTQRLGLAKALMHRPKVLILDEPINGLDPSGIVEIRELLKKLAAEGTTIFLSSHILEEISKQATRIGIIHEGKLIKEIETKALDSERKKVLVLDSTNNEGCLKLLASKGIKASLNSGGSIEIESLEPIMSPEIISSCLFESGIGLKQLFLVREDLEAYFLRVIKNEKHLQ